MNLIIILLYRILKDEIVQNSAYMVISYKFNTKFCAKYKLTALKIKYKFSIFQYDVMINSL